MGTLQGTSGWCLFKWNHLLVGVSACHHVLICVKTNNEVSWYVSYYYFHFAAAKDEWDFEYLGDSNHPFIKANYPHHEGIWGWGTNADQIVLVVKNIRKSLVEYHDILWDIGYAKTWADARVNIDKIYGERPPLEDFRVWRDLRVFDEISWYG